MPDNLPDQVKSPELLADIRRMIEETRSAVAAIECPCVWARSMPG